MIIIPLPCRYQSSMIQRVLLGQHHETDLHYTPISLRQIHRRLVTPALKDLIARLNLTQAWNLSPVQSFTHLETSTWMIQRIKPQCPSFQASQSLIAGLWLECSICTVAQQTTERAAIRAFGLYDYVVFFVCPCPFNPGRSPPNTTSRYTLEVCNKAC
jgi:hypothetical protein